MKRFLLWAQLVLMFLLLICSVVFAQVDSTGAGGGNGGADSKTVGLIWASGVWFAQFVVGWLWKKFTPEEVPNQLIPIITAIIGVIGFVWLLGMGFKEAVVLAMATAHGATLVAEVGDMAKKSSAAGGGA